MKALNQLLEMNLPEKELMGMGLEIGADVPFFFLKSAAMGSGIGERLKKVKLPDLWYVLIYPNFEVSTRWAYQHFVLTHSTAQNVSFDKGAEKHRSGSTLSMHQPLGWVAEGLTNQQFHFNLHKFLKTPDGISRILLNHLEAVVSEEISSDWHHEKNPSFCWSFGRYDDRQRSHGFWAVPGGEECSRGL